MTDEAPDQPRSVVNGEARHKLIEFLVDRFDERELKRFVRRLPEGDELSRELPGGSASSTDIAEALVVAAHRRGSLDEAFFRILLELRPRLRADIVSLRSRCLPHQAVADPVASGTGTGSNLDGLQRQQSRAPYKGPHASRVAEAPGRGGLRIVSVGVLVLVTGIAVWKSLPGAPQIPNETIVSPMQAPRNEELSSSEVSQAHSAVQGLGLKESSAELRALQQIIDDPARSPRAKDQARLRLAELLLMWALAHEIAMAIDPVAQPGELQIPTAEGPKHAASLLAAVRSTEDSAHRERVGALQALVEDKAWTERPPDAGELITLREAAPLWRRVKRTPPMGLTTSLRQLPEPSSLAQCVLALALWRGGDTEGARKLAQDIVTRIDDHPLAPTLLAAMTRSESVAPVRITEVTPSLPPESAPKKSSPQTPASPTPKPEHQPPIPPAPTPEPAPKPVQPAEDPYVSLKVKGEAIGRDCLGSDTDDESPESITLTITIGADGKISGAVPGGSTAKLPLAKCMAPRVEKLPIQFSGPRAAFPSHFTVAPRP